MNWLRHLLGVATLCLAAASGHYLWALLADDNPDSGYSIVLLFEEAEGLREGAGIRYRGVRVGEVRRIRLGNAGRNVEVHCALEPQAGATVRASSRFWIVRPRFGGLVEGASGLDTLIKDSYIVYETPSADIPPLPTGSRLPGLEAPPNADTVGIERGARAGDLELELLFAENRGLRSGARVVFRGQAVGRVRNVELNDAADAVRVSAIVAKQYRHTVREGARFWIAHPSVTADWSSGFQVQDIETLLAGATLNYAPPEDRTAPPASDHAVLVGLSERPDIDWDDPAAQPARTESPPVAPDDPIGPALVTVHYRFVEPDFWSPDDEYRFEGIGVALLTSDGVAAVLVPRSSVEGRWLVEDAIGEPEITDESWRVTLADGSVHGAGRVWVAPNDGDLALLRLDARARAAIGELPSVVSYPTASELATSAIEAFGLDANGTIQRRSGSLSKNGDLTGPAAEMKRAVLLANGRWVGVVSHRSGQARAVMFAELPTSLRSRTP